MQFHNFTNGGCVAHKLTLPDSPMRFSAWFNAAGHIVDCEGIDRLNRSRPATRRQIIKLAARYAGIARDQMSGVAS